jgi:hypothetical protein
MNARQAVILAAAAVGLYWLSQQPADAPCPGPDCPVSPTPCPGPGPCPAPAPKPKPSLPRRPWLTEAGSPVGEQGATACKCCAPCKCDLGKCACRVLVGGRCSRSCECGPGVQLVEQRFPVGKISLGGPVAPDGKTEVQVDLPVEQRIKNKGGSDGAGLCVNSSIEMAARWAALEQMRGLRAWSEQHPGGSYPSKVDKQLKEYCQAKGIQCPDYIQYEGSDPAILELALKTGRLAAVTYSGRDGVRYKGPISHMVTLAHFDGQWACVLDNNGNHPNGVGENELLWMTPDEFISRWKGQGGGWAFVWLEPGPPPVPRNR